jgi:putative transposase
LGLNLRIKPKKSMNRVKPEPLTVPESINAVWSIDFMHDQMTDGRWQIVPIVQRHRRLQP